MKVYVITKGCYSNYHIVGVSLDKKRAEEIAKAMDESNESWLNETRVEEYNTDAFVTGLRYHVSYIKGDWTADIDDYDTHQSNHTYNERSFVVYAKDKEHAIKIAQDMRAEYMAKESGVKL